MNRPVLRYHGGKWRLAPWVIMHFPRHARYVEPYCGVASVLMRKPRVKQEIINDMNAAVVNVFRCLRDPDLAATLEAQLRLTPFAHDEYNASNEPSDDPVELARRTFVRSFQSFGATGVIRHTSGFRLDLQSRRTTEHCWPEIPSFIKYWCERLQGVVIESMPAVKLINRVDKANNGATLFYVNPPYVHKSDRDMRNVYEFEMTEDDHRELSDALHSIKGQVVLSGYPSELYKELYGDWQQVSRPHVANCAKQTTESLWISPNALTQPTLDLFAERNE